MNVEANVGGTDEQGAMFGPTDREMGRWKNSGHLAGMCMVYVGLGG